MSKGLLNDDAIKGIEDELSELALMHDYLSKGKQQDEEFSAINKRDEFVLLDGGVKVPNILMLKNAKGVTEILNKHRKTIDKDIIDEVSEKTGLEKEDIMALMQDGMEIEEISSAAEALPYKEISESAAIREMIRAGIDSSMLTMMQEKGIEVVPMKNGSLQVTSLEKIAQVDEKGLMTFDESWFEKNLKPFEEVGLINLSEELALQDIEHSDMEKSEFGSLKVVSMQRRKEELTKEEMEKQEIAKVLGEDPDNIVNVIRIEDRDAGSKLFNYDMEDKAVPIMVRFKNDNFKLMEEKEDGSKVELQGFEATPVSKQVASLLKDTSMGLFINLKPGEVKAGKTNPNQERYDIFQIRRAGESRDDDSNQLLYAGFSGKTDVSVIQRMENGDTQFARVPVSSVYPKNIYIEDNTGDLEKSTIIHEQDDNMQRDVHDEPTVKFDDIEKRKELLEKVLEIERQIVEIEKQGEAGSSLDSLSKNTGHEENDPDISDSFANRSKELPDLYSQRSKILTKLGMNEADLKKSQEMADDDWMPGGRRTRV